MFEHVIVARGSDALWFRHLLDSDTHSRMTEITHSFDRRTIERAIVEDLSLIDFTPKLHLPMLAAIAQGPAYPQPQLPGPAGRPHPGSLLSVHCKHVS